MLFFYFCGQGGGGLGEVGGKAQFCNFVGGGGGGGALGKVGGGGARLSEFFSQRIQT